MTFSVLILSAVVSTFEGCLAPSRNFQHSGSPNKMFLPEMFNIRAHQ